jgi:flagellar motor switch protein FliG
MASTQTAAQKAALLLMSLDPATASELLKGLSDSQIESLSLEMARMERGGKKLAQSKSEAAKEFCTSLESSQSAGLSLGTFFGQTLHDVLGEKKAEEIQHKVTAMVEKRNPFEFMNSATVDELALALAGECPQTISVVLSELQPRKAAELLPLLDKETCFKAVWDMATPRTLNTRIKERMAAIISQRLMRLKGETVVRKDKENLRNIAMMLSDTDRNLRNEAIESLKTQNPETGSTILNLMVTWHDIPTIADRSLQEALRSVESSKLAIALYQAEDEIIQKVRANISARAAEALDEEMSLMQEPLEEEVLEAREQVVRPLRDANQEGTLRRVKGA